MGRTAILAVKVIGDAKGGSQALNQTATAADKMSRRMAAASRVAKVGLTALVAGGVSAAKAAAEDEKAQAILGQTLRRNAGATKTQVAATEKWIATTARATGVADDQLRPALGALVRATGSTAKSQKALQVAMDVSAATGKPLQSVSNAIAKGYNGQTTALGRLVPGISQAALKSGDMSRIMGELAQKTGGSAAKAAETTEGKFQRLSVRFGEIKESVGTVLLPAMTVLAVVLGKVAGLAEKHETAFLILAGVLGVVAVATIATNAAYKVFVAGSRALTAATKAATIAQKAFNFAVKKHPIALVVAAIALVIGALIYAYKHSDRFRKIVDTVGRVAVKAFKAILTPIKWVVDKVKELIAWLRKLRWPSVPKAISRLFGRGGPPPAPGGPGGFGGPPRPAYSVLPGRGGPGAGGFLAAMSGSQRGTYITINVNGALDPESVARQIKLLLRRQDVRLGASL